MGGGECDGGTVAEDRACPSAGGGVVLWCGLYGGVGPNEEILGDRILFEEVGCCAKPASGSVLSDKVRKRERYLIYPEE